MRAKLISESIKHLKPRSEEEIKNYHKNLSSHEKLYIGVEEGLLWLIKDAKKEGEDIHYGYDWALKNACDCGYIDIVKFLIDEGADIHDARDYALRHASYYGYIEIVKLLLEAGADVHAENDEALNLAKGQRHTEIIKLLKQYGAKDYYPGSSNDIVNESAQSKITFIRSPQSLREKYPNFRKTIRLKNGRVILSEIVSAVFLKRRSMKSKNGSSIQPKTTDVYATK